MSLIPIIVGAGVGAAATRIINPAPPSVPVTTPNLISHAFDWADVNLTDIDSGSGGWAGGREITWALPSESTFLFAFRTRTIPIPDADPAVEGSTATREKRLNFFGQYGTNPTRLIYVNAIRNIQELSTPLLVWSMYMNMVGSWTSQGAVATAGRVGVSAAVYRQGVIVPTTERTLDGENFLALDRATYVVQLPARAGGVLLTAHPWLQTRDGKTEGVVVTHVGTVTNVSRAGELGQLDLA